MSNEVAEIEYVDSSFTLHEFGLSFLTNDIKFQVLKMKNSTLVWVGDAQNPQLSDLSYGTQIAPNGDLISTKILGVASSCTTSEAMAKKLTKKLKRPVYVSFNIQISEISLLEKIETHLLEEMELNPEVY